MFWIVVSHLTPNTDEDGTNKSSSPVGEEPLSNPAIFGEMLEMDAEYEGVF